jgi:hypothetical protein
MMETANEISARALPGKHTELVHEMLVLDAFLELPLDQQGYESITRSFVLEMLWVLGMEPLGELGIFPAVDEREPGWSFIQPITTSHVSAHYFGNPGGRPHIRLDAYSCASIDCKSLLAVCHKHFRLDTWLACFIERQLDHPYRRSLIEMTGAGSRVVSESPMCTQAPLSREKVS